MIEMVDKTENEQIDHSDVGINPEKIRENSFLDPGVIDKTFRVIEIKESDPEFLIDGTEQAKLVLQDRFEIRKSQKLIEIPIYQGKKNQEHINPAMVEGIPPHNLTSLSDLYLRTFEEIKYCNRQITQLKLKISILDANIYSIHKKRQKKREEIESQIDEITQSMEQALMEAGLYVTDERARELQEIQSDMIEKHTRFQVVEDQLKITNGYSDKERAKLIVEERNLNKELEEIIPMYEKLEREFEEAGKKISEPFLKQIEPFQEEKEGIESLWDSSLKSFQQQKEEGQTELNKYIYAKLSNGKNKFYKTDSENFEDFEKFEKLLKFQYSKLDIGKFQVLFTLFQYVFNKEFKLNIEYIEELLFHIDYIYPHIGSYPEYKSAREEFSTSTGLISHAQHKKIHIEKSVLMKMKQNILGSIIKCLVFLVKNLSDENEIDRFVSLLSDRYIVNGSLEFQNLIDFQKAMKLTKDGNEIIQKLKIVLQNEGCAETFLKNFDKKKVSDDMEVWKIRAEKMKKRRKMDLVFVGSAAALVISFSTFLAIQVILSKLGVDERPRTPVRNLREPVRVAVKYEYPAHSYEPIKVSKMPTKKTVKQVINPVSYTKKEEIEPERKDPNQEKKEALKKKIQTEVENVKKQPAEYNRVGNFNKHLQIPLKKIQRGLEKPFKNFGGIKYVKESASNIIKYIEEGIKEGVFDPAEQAEYDDLLREMKVLKKRAIEISGILESFGGKFPKTPTEKDIKDLEEKIRNMEDHKRVKMSRAIDLNDPEFQRIDDELVKRRALMDFYKKFKALTDELDKHPECTYKGLKRVKEEINRKAYLAPNLSYLEKMSVLDQMYTQNLTPEQINARQRYVQLFTEVLSIK